MVILQITLARLAINHCGSERKAVPRKLILRNRFPTRQLVLLTPFYILTKSQHWKKIKAYDSSRSFRIQQGFCVKIQLESLQLTINSQSIIRSLKTHNINNYTVLRQQGVLQVIRSVQVPHLCNIHSCFDFNKYISNIKVFVLVTKK